MLDLRPIKYRLKTATPGPWSIDVTYFVPRSIWARVGKLFSADDATFADCALIAHAPQDLADLMAEVERLRTLIIAHRDGCNCDETQSETPPRQCDACFALYEAVENA